MLSKDEVLEVIGRFMTDHPGDFDDKEPDEILEELVDKALLFEVAELQSPRSMVPNPDGRDAAPYDQADGSFSPPQDPGRPAELTGAGGQADPGRRFPAARRAAHVSEAQASPVAQALGELASLPGWTQVQGDVAAAQVNRRGRIWPRFQVDRVDRVIFRALGEKRTRGVIIGAGTGSGKTLAFYLPAFAALAPGLLQSKHQLHTLALYPRNELLRDQLREAVSAALEVADVLKKSGLRHIRVGALYGATPAHGRSWQVNGTSTSGPVWQKQGRDVVCPYLPCSTCGGDLLWSEPDRLANRDKLTCSRCGLVLDGDVALTRKTLQDRPPDILFTTTEMLNQHATSDLGRLLGWRTGRGRAATPKLVLLDEVHTYSGVHGAQVALLLRRWRYSVPAPVTFVGLSATLRDASSFFAQLTGVDQVAIANIVPKANDMTAEGREYALAVRGDPVSGPSLLSTSIQTAMLYGRALDPPGREYAYSSVGFLFTDDLDVTNRFYDDLRDAEGCARAVPVWQDPACARGPALAGRAAGVRTLQGRPVMESHAADRLDARSGRGGRRATDRADVISGCRGRLGSRSHRRDRVPRGRVQRPAGRPSPPAQGPPRCRVLHPAARSRGPSTQHPPVDSGRLVRLWPRPARIPGLRLAVRARVACPAAAGR